MVMTDPIADMLTRIRNANTLRSNTVVMPSNSVKVRIAKILKDEGFIVDFASSGDLKKQLTITLKYAAGGTRVINGIKRISKPGLRVTASAEKLPRVLKGLGIAIISTSQGIMTDRQARTLGIGGEVLAYVW